MTTATKVRAKIELRLKKLDERVDRLTEAWKDSRQSCRELEHTLELIRKSDMRAIKMWQEAHPGNDLVWPDRGKMIFWLLERNKELEDLNRAHVHMTAHVGGYPIDEYNNCAECGGGPEGSIPHDVTCKHFEDS